MVFLEVSMTSDVFHKSRLELKFMMCFLAVGQQKTL